MTEKELEKRLDESYKVGISSGLEEAAAFLMQEAHKKFEAQQDNGALLLRSLSDELRKRAKEAHPRKG